MTDITKHLIGPGIVIIGKEIKKVGRPTKYKDEFCEQVIEHMAKGLSVESFAAIVGVHKDTVYEWMKQETEFSDSVKCGYAKSLLFWENIGLHGTVGKLKGFNASAYALNMANKHKWTNRTDLTTDGQKIESPVLFIPEEKE